MEAKRPSNEAARLAALQRYRVLDTEPEGVFDRITRIAALTIGAPMSLVSLVDDTRQWTKSSYGIEAGEAPREIAFCAHAILQSDTLIVEDARKDTRFADNPLVTGEPGIRFYAGAPLVSGDDVRLGTLCVIDTEPRRLSAREVAVLNDLARMVMEEFENRLTALAAVEEARTAAAHLSHSEGTLAAILDIAPEAVMTVDEEMEIIHFNKAAERIFGYSAKEIIGYPFEILIPERYWAVHRQHVARFTDSAEPTLAMDDRQEIIGRRKDGEEFPASASVSKLRIDNELILTVMLRDITERKAAEKALALSEERLRDVAETAYDRFYEMDENFRFTAFVNPKGHDAYAHWPNAIGMTRWEVVDADPESDEKWRAHREDLMAHREFQDFEFSLTDENGEEIYTSVSGKPIFDENGAFKGYRGSANDISKRKKMELALLESEQTLRLVTDSVPALIAFIGADERFRYVNSSYAEMLGKTAEELIGNQLKDFISSSLYLRTAPPRRAVLSGKSQRYQETVERGAGEDVIVDVSLVPQRGPDSEVQGYFALTRDITELKQAETRLLHAEKMATLGEMAAGIAHEIAQPLNIIRLATQTALEEVEGGNVADEDLTEDIQTIDRQVERMAEIIDHMRIFSRNDVQPFNPFNPLDVLEDACLLVDKQYAALGIELEKHLPDDGGLVNGSPGQLEQVVLNIFANAKDAILADTAPAAGSRGGKITVELDADVQTGDARISITDTGGGIDDGALGKLFDPFFTTKEVGKGTGLGLSISFSIVEAMGGRIDARNVSDGACFTISLPTIADSVSAVGS